MRAIWSVQVVIFLFCQDLAQDWMLTVKKEKKAVNTIIIDEKIVSKIVSIFCD